MITVLRNPFVRGWPRHQEGGERAYALDLGPALERAYRTDAHLCQYTPPNGRRLTREAIGKVRITMRAIIFDVDCHEVHGSSQPAPISWRARFDERFHRLAKVHPNPFGYHTRGGARIVYTLRDPFTIASPADARKWSQGYAVAIAYLARRFEIASDPACHDWQRLFRLPRATRKPGGSPESWPTCGDVRTIGALSIKATTADVDTARATSKAFSERRIVDYKPCVSSGRGLLYHLLAARGDVLREHTDAGAYVVRCPRERDHSTGRTGDGSTLLYLPAAGEEVGAIHCLHAHCAGLAVRDWVRCFSEQEIDEARQAAGIARAA